MTSGRRVTMSVRCLIVDPFTIIVVGGLGVFIGALLLLGWLYPGSGADVLDWKPTRSAELEAQNDADDVAQMIEAQNAIRRRRGLPDRTEDEVEESVRRDKEELRARAQAYWEEQGEQPPQGKWHGS
jgi:hypothetical protein